MQRATARASSLEASIELLSSMRFAISLLTVLAIASVIGAVVQQNEPANAYLNQFGQFWEPVFASIGLYAVYSAKWFLAILAFLVLSTVLCIVRQSVPMLREMRGFREHAREASLRLFARHASLAPTLPHEARRGAVTAYLTGAGFRFRVDEREDGVLIAARQGAAGRIGYFLAHAAIVLICAGGLLDGNLPLALQIRLGGKSPTSGDQPLARIPASARLDPDNWSYHGNVYIPEGGSTDFAVLNVDDGVLLQSLPFKIALKRFRIDYYASGMPRRYASDLVITDSDSGQSFERTIEVNKPLEYRGVTLFQSSFDDGGSILRFALRDLAPGARPPHPLDGEVGTRLPLAKFGYGYTLEISGFRPINVENIAPPSDNERFGSFFGSGAQTQNGENLRNLGPVYSFKLRDEAGQAREFNNYMLPLEIEGRKYLVSGVRASQAEAFHYLRIPLDSDGKADTWFAIRQLFFDPERRAALAERLTARMLDTSDESTMRERLKETAENTLALFARGGLAAISDFIDSTESAAEHPASEEDRQRAGAAFIQILQGLIWDAWMSAREASGHDALEIGDEHAQFIRDTLIALVDSIQYGAPLYLQLTDYKHRQATVLQAARAPGKSLVYTGSLLLALGVFAMLYIRERRLFVLLKADEALVAMSSNRKTIDTDETFARHCTGIGAILGAACTNNLQESP
ncbi:MAG: cytochrome c biogenesis protein ResB [Azoarcus sp.]|jgi:cytochrome c biogenesis protein|nr:cytochrome c biogenesis protein ResB [Azoarcus sp.]